MLELRDLTCGYGREFSLGPISARLPAGSVSVILGPNGCGKTTLLKALCGILPASGQVLLDGQSLLGLPPRELARRVSYLTQNRPVPELTARRLVLHGRFPYLGYPRRYGPADLDAVEAAMAQMEVTELAERMLPTLSGGQRQRVYLAMALAQDTPVILLDEPTTFLDVGAQARLMAQARQLAALGKTVVMVLHDLSQALRRADQVLVLDGGALAAAGTPEEVFSSGVLNRVFSVKVMRMDTGGTWQYYYEEAEP